MSKLHVCHPSSSSLIKKKEKNRKTEKKKNRKAYTEKEKQRKIQRKTEKTET